MCVTEYKLNFKATDMFATGKFTPPASAGILLKTKDFQPQSLKEKQHKC